VAPEKPWLDGAARAIADGQPVDWDGLASTAGVPDRPSVAHLRLVARIAEVHRDQSADETTAPGPRCGGAVPDVVGQSWGSLALAERIGGGAYGDVFRARDPRLDRDVALKLLRVGCDPAAGAEVIDEARRLARVRHPHVVTIHGADYRDGRVGLWMELVRGRSLDREVAERGPFSAAEAALIGVDLCGALAAVHAGGRIVLMDFGSTCDQMDLSRAAPDGAVGTPLYAAPEVLAGGEVSASSDLYSLGVVLYHLVTGAYPVSGRTLDDVRAAHRRCERRGLKDARPDLPDEFITVVERAIAPNPEDRFASAGTMAAALSAILAVAPGRAQVSDAVRPPGERAREGSRSLRSRLVPATRRGRVTAALAVVALAAASACGVHAVLRPNAAGASLGFQPRDWLLVTVFDNRTGNPRLDGTVEYALERELQNSRFVNLPSRERIHDALRLMRKPRDTSIDEAIGREVCLRDGGIRALVHGRVDKLGSAYQIGARVVEPATGRTVLAAAVEAPSEERIIAAVRELSERIRTSLGEHDRDLESTGQMLEKVTTPSLKALQLYSQGMALLMTDRRDDWRTAGALFEQATREDSEFASAYAYLSWTWQPSLTWGDRAKQLTASERAFQLAEHATERERLFIRGTYFQQRGQVDAARAEYEAVVRIYPDHYWGVNNLAAVSRDTDTALPYLVRLADLRPNHVFYGARAARALIEAGRKDEAVPYVERARAIQRQGGAPSDPNALGITLEQWVDCFPIWQLWIEGDAVGALAGVRELSAAAERDRDDDLRKALVIWHIILGRLREADALLLRSLAELEHSGQQAPRSQRLPDVMPEVLLAWNAELRGDREGARHWLQRLSSRVAWADRDDWWESVFMPARAGLAADVRQSLANPEKWWLKAEAYVAWANGDLALAAGRPAEAAALLTTALARFPPRYITRHLLVQSLVRALEESGRPEAALDIIVNNLQPNDRSPFHYLNLSAWLDLQASRARLLRRLGRFRQAESIEAELRRYLRYADADLLMVRQLGR
jgi:tetratricopeptide (TPR) repeat protein